MLASIRALVVSLVLLTALTGIAYPLLTLGLAQSLFPRQANGSLVMRDGRVIGSLLIGQAFDEARYFSGRPAATTQRTSPRDPGCFQTYQGTISEVRSRGARLVSSPWR